MAISKAVVTLFVAHGLALDRVIMGAAVLDTGARALLARVLAQLAFPILHSQEQRRHREQPHQPCQPLHLANLHRPSRGGIRALSVAKGSLLDVAQQSEKLLLLLRQGTLGAFRTLLVRRIHLVKLA